MKKPKIVLGKGLAIELHVTANNGETIKIPMSKKDMQKLTNGYNDAEREVRRYWNIKENSELFEENGWTIELFNQSCDDYKNQYGIEPCVFNLTPTSWSIFKGCNSFEEATVAAKKAYSLISPINTVIWDISQHEDLDDGYGQEWVTLNRKEAMHFEKWMYENYTKPFLKAYEKKYQIL